MGSYKGLTFGRHSGEYSPPAPCFDFTLMSSAISLGGSTFILVLNAEDHRTYYCRARRSSLSFPTSARRIRTSPARALLKSFKYL